MKNLIHFINFIALIGFMGCTYQKHDAERQGRALMRVWETGNTDQLVDIMSEDAVYVAAQQMSAFNGLEKIKEYVGHVNSFAENLKVEVVSVSAHEDFAAIEWLMSGIQSKPITGKVDAVTNKEFSLNGVTIIEIENGLIVKATDYMDVLGFVLQLGACVELPGGVNLGCEQNDQESIMDWFTGLWKLYIIEMQDPATGKWKMFLDGLQGYILYDEKGNMAVHLTSRGYQNTDIIFHDFIDTVSMAELKHRTQSYVYFANYTLDTDKKIVTHERISHSNPNLWNETVQREYEFSGDTLVLTTLGRKDATLRVKWIPY